MNRIVLFLFISIVLHLSAILFLRISDLKITPVPKTIVEIQDSKAVSTASNSTKTKNYRSGKSFQAFKSLRSWQQSDFKIVNGQVATGVGTNKDNPFTAWGSGAGEFERISDYLLFKGIQDQVEGLLFYPGVLARNGIQGTVNSRLVLNNAGECDWSLSQINSANPHLRIYILHVLKKLCVHNFKRELAKRESTNVDLSFSFAITEHNEKSIINSEKRVIGNVLTFYRNSHQSIAEWNLGPFRGMFPIPMVAVDFMWLKEHWDSYVNSKDPIKEFDKEFSRI